MGCKFVWLIFAIVTFVSQIDFLAIHLRLVTVHGMYMIDITVGSINAWTCIMVILMISVYKTSMYEYGERGTVGIDAVNGHFPVE